MIVCRFKVQVQPGKAEELHAAFRDVVAPSRAVEGAVSFDIGRDVTDPDTFVAVEVFESREALDRQESLPQVATVLGLLGEAAAAPPEATVYEVSSSAPWGS